MPDASIDPREFHRFGLECPTDPEHAQALLDFLRSQPAGFCRRAKLVRKESERVGLEALDRDGRRTKVEYLTVQASNGSFVIMAAVRYRDSNQTLLIPAAELTKRVSA